MIERAIRLLWMEVDNRSARLSAGDRIGGDLVRRVGDVWFAFGAAAANPLRHASAAPNAEAPLTLAKSRLLMTFIRSPSLAPAPIATTGRT